MVAIDDAEHFEEGGEARTVTILKEISGEPCALVQFLMTRVGSRSTGCGDSRVGGAGGEAGCGSGQATENCEIGVGHRSRSTGRSDASAGSFEVILVGSWLGSEARIRVGDGFRGKATRAGVIMQVTDAAGAEEVDASGDSLMQVVTMGMRAMVAPTWEWMKEEGLKEQKEFP